MPIKINYNGNETVSQSDSKQVVINCKGKTMEDDILVTDTRYDDFWDFYQDNGTRTYYPYMFAGQGWSNTTFKPKYDIKPSGSISGTFRQTGYLNLRQRLLDCGVTLDTSKATDFQYAFAYGRLTELPTINATSATTLNATFTNTAGSSRLTKIEELVVHENLTYTNPFNNCDRLTYIRISGTIGNSLNMQHCPLDKDSIVSIMNALSETTSGKTLTLSEAAVAKAFETAGGFNDGEESEEWDSLVTIHGNWDIVLV